MKKFSLMFLLLWQFGFGKPVIVGPEDRPAKLDLPKSYEPSQQTPLILFLHGFGIDADTVEFLLGFVKRKNKYDYAVLRPEGTPDPDGKLAWNATPWCCGSEETRADDVSYLLDLVDSVKSTYNFGKVYVVGYSNGGFMANRLACETNATFAAYASVSGGNFNDLTVCQPTEPVSYIHVHGTADKVVDFAGANQNQPGATRTVEFWADYNQCTEPLETKKAYNLSNFSFSLSNEGFPLEGRPLDFITPGFSKETDQLSFSNCANNAKVELLKMNDLGPAPIYTGELNRVIWDFFTDAN